MASNSKTQHVAGTQKASDELIGITIMEKAARAQLKATGKTDAQIEAYLASCRAESAKAGAK